MIWMLSIILFLIFAYLAIGIFDIRRNIFVQSINSIAEGDICLTFDDGPDSTMTPKILDILKKHNVQANFFLIGNACQSNQDIVKQIYLGGHTIGCHTFSHRIIFPLYSLDRMEAELVKTNNLIKSIISEEVLLFRPPFGITNPNINKTLKKLAMTSVGWDIRSLDTITKDAEKLSNRVIDKINKGGSIILFHDRCESTLEILENIITYCHEKGLKFKTINNA